MHVCHFSDTAVESDYFKNIAAGLTRNGVRVSLIELGSGNMPEWLAEKPDVSYLSFNAGSKLQYPSAVVRLARFLNDNDVDILHTHLYFSGLIGVLAKRLQRRTIVTLMRHHTSVVRMLGSRLHVAVDKWMAEKADHVMTVSQAARKYMIEVDRINRKDIEVVYLGFDFDKMSPKREDRARVRREFGFTDDDLVIGYIGNFGKGKGHIQLIAAFEKIVKDLPQAKLFFVGRGMLDEVRDAAAKFPQNQIIFAGWRDDVSACLNAMDIFVQPSLSEAFSQVLVEAMGVGLPVIATNVGGAAEVIEDGVNGFLIEPDNVEALGERVTELCRNAALRQQIGTVGRKSVAERFTVELLVKRHLELYESWIAERQPQN
ncbi:MAG: glycosyltransferase family 4 protein [Pyrinomonadaceae bacterium]